MKIVKKIFKFFILCFDRIKSITKTKKYYTDKQNFYFGKIGLDRNKALTKINNLNLARAL